MSQLKCLPGSQVVDSAPDQTILEALLMANIDHTHACGGNAQCSTCRVMIMQGVNNCTEPTFAERSLAKRLKFPVHVRLACQTKVTGDVSIWRMVLDSDDVDIVDGQVNTDLNDSQQFVSALFASVRGVSDFDEQNFPYDVVYIMSRYFYSLSKFLTDYGAQVSHAGNTTMAIFGAKDTPDIAIERSVWAGWEVLKLVEGLNVRLEQLGYRPLQVTLGINCGQALILPTDNQNKTAFGEVVDRANRIEAGNRRVGSKFLISAPVAEAMRGKLVLGSSYEFLYSEKEEKYQVFEVVDLLGTPPTKVDRGMMEASFSSKILGFMKRLTGGK
jgi:adenylate cyclase